MLKDVMPFENVWRILRGTSPSTEAIASFVRFIEDKLGAEMVYDATHFPAGNPALLPLAELAERLKAAGIIQSYARVTSPADEPPLAHWRAKYRDGDESQSGGSATDDEHHALIATLAEAVERHIWYEASDYFDRATAATIRQIETKGRYIAPESFAGFSSAQRTQDHLRITPERVYLWIRATSLTHAGPVWVPAQVVSAHRDAHRLIRQGFEPLLRAVITNGLATHTSRDAALLGGALELIERDAYMILWMNQLTMPRIDLDALGERSHSLHRLLARCRRYRLRPHIVRMPTDAPTFAFLAVIEDESGLEPRLTIGLNAGQNAAHCAEHALIEALRARRGIRSQLARGSSVAQKIGHYDRLLYWAQGNSHKLDFLIAGGVEKIRREAWESDDTAAHLARIVSWVRESGHEYAVVPFTRSQKNIPGWHIEMSVIPHLQPMHFSEAQPHLGGERLQAIPKKIGRKPRATVFTDEPHPFA